MKKFIFTTLILFFVLLGFSAYQYFKFNDGKLHVVFCNVGQGDGILIRTPDSQDIIFDAGPDNSILTCLSKHTPFWDRDIELMILSHPHSDHMAGMVSILKNYEVSAFATEGLINTTFIYKKLMKTLNEKRIKTRVIYEGDSFEAPGNLKLNVLGPSREFVARTSGGVIKESKEDGSLTVRVSIGEFDAVLTGDSPLEEIESIQNISDIEIFQIPHHGSRFNISEDILRKIKPKFAVISVGQNKYGHPSNKVIKILKDLNIKTFRTDERGDIEIISDGKSFKIL